MRRFEKEHIEEAKKTGGILFAMTVDRKYTLPNHNGGASDTTGTTADPKQIAVARFAMDVLAFCADPIARAEALLCELKAEASGHDSNQ